MFVVRGTPYKLDEVRLFEHPQYGEQRRLAFRLAHPDIQVKPGDWEDRFEASNATIEKIVEAADAQDVLELVVRSNRVKGRDGKPDWFNLIVVDVL